jgi:hypothetical protein
MAKDLGTLEINQAELMQKVTFKVKMTHERELKIRLWIAKQLLIFTAWIANSNIEFIE